MKKYLSIVKYVCVLSVFLSCNTLKVLLRNNHRQSVSLPLDKDWRDTLTSRKDEIEKASFETLDLLSLSDWRKHNPKIPQTNGEKKDLKLIHVDSYRIDKVSYEEMNAETSIENILAIDKDKASYFILKNESFLMSGLYDLKTQRWKQTTLIMKSAADSLSLWYFKKKLPIFFVYVYLDNEYDMYCLSYIENGVIKRVDLAGTGVLLKDYLLNLKKK